MLSSVLFLALAGSWLGSAGQFHWLPDLFSHFRLQYAMLSAAAAMVAVWQRQWLLLAVALATLSLNAWLLACQAWPQASGTAPDETPLQVISLNVLTSNPDKKRVLAYLTASAADVLFLMEIDADWAAALEPLKRSHPHHHLLPRPDNFAFFSRRRVRLSCRRNCCSKGGVWSFSVLIRRHRSAVICRRCATPSLQRWPSGRPARTCPSCSPAI